MASTLIYIGDDLLDLDQSTIVSITIQSVNLGELKTRNVSFTNQFKVKATENNIRIFGYSNSERSRSAIPYRYSATKIIQNGIETLTGTTILNRFVDGFFYINVYEEIRDIFDFLEGKTLRDIMPITDSEWTPADMDAARNTTSGLISAIVQWGKEDAIFNAVFFLPSFYYHTIITSILTSTGLTLSGSILTDSRFKELVIPFCGDSFVDPTPVAIYNLVLQLVEAVPLTPTWNARFEIITPFTRRGLVVTGNGDQDINTIPANDTSLVVTVYKTSNSGITQDVGDVSFYLNAGLSNTQSFLNGDNLDGTGSSYKQYTFTGLVANDELKVIVTEG